MTYHVELLPAQRQAANAGELQLQMPIPPPSSLPIMALTLGSWRR